MKQLAFAFGVAFFLVGFTSIFAGDADDAITKERKRYQGTWQVIALTVDGNKIGEADAKKYFVVNELDGKWKIEADDGKVISHGTNVIDPSKTPKTVNLTLMKGDNEDETTLGIYEFNDDTRKVCFAKAGKDRPTDFTSTAGNEQILATLKRVKK